MASPTLEEVPADVRRVVEQFAQWRGGKQGRERIPARLWEAAVRLCGAYSLHGVARWLGLNHTELRARAGGRSGRGPRRRQPAFVRWSLPAGVAPLLASPAEYVVEVGGRGPQRIHVRGASVVEVAALARALKRAG